MDNIKNGKLIYHLTSIKNLDSIIKNGIQPRNSINPNIDIADSEIIDKRQNVNDINLLEYVPFHFFINNPFDGAVKKYHINKNFVYICVRRCIAKEKGFKIIPIHPLSNDILTKFPKIIYDYNEGFNLIDWDIMETREYNNQNCKNICLAECLYYGTMTINYIFSIVVKDDESYKKVDEILKLNNILNSSGNKYIRDDDIHIFLDIENTWF